MVLTKELKNNLRILVKKLNNTKEEITIKKIRFLLLSDNNSIKFNEEEWKKIKLEIKFEVSKLLSSNLSSSPPKTTSSSSSPVKPVKPIKPVATKKYDRAAEKNLKTFMGLIAEPTPIDVEEDDDEEEDEEEEEEEEEDSTSESESEVEVEIKSKSKSKSSKSKSTKVESSESSESEAEEPPKKKPRTSTTSTSNKNKNSKGIIYLSKEIISDSDEEAASPDKRKTKLKPQPPTKLISSPVSIKEDFNSNSKSGSSNKKEKKGKGKEKEMIPITKKSTSTSTSTKTKTVPKPRAQPIPKEGEAPLGTTSEEARIKQLKALLKAGGIPRPFTPSSTGSEKNLKVEERMKLLISLLINIKLLSSISGNGNGWEKCKLPSINKALEVGERRALEKEMLELQGVPITTGLRGGKKRNSTVLNSNSEESNNEENNKSESESEQEDSNKNEKKSGHISAKAFAAFLGDQESDSD